MKTELIKASEQPAPEMQVLKSVGTSLFSNKDAFEHSQRVATMLSKSELVPKDYQGKVANCLIALELANRIGASPLMVMQNLYIVHGKPGWSSQFLIATLNACGRFSPLRYEENDNDGGSCRAYAEDKHTGEKLFGAWVTMKMADAEGWIKKTGSKWQTMPQMMRRYRAAAFFTRQFAPEVSMGIATSDEVYDITATTVSSKVITPEVKAEKESERLQALINSCDTVDDLLAIEQDVDDEHRMLFDMKMESLKQPADENSK